MPPDFEKYRLDELESSLAGIDREKYPENYAQLLEIITRRKLGNPPEAQGKAPPEGFQATLQDDGSIEIVYRESFRIDLIAIHALFLFVWTIGGIIAAVNQELSWSLLFGFAIWAFCEYAFGKQMLLMVFGRTCILLTGNDMQVMKVFHKWQKTSSIRKDWITRVWQIKDRQEGSETEPGWGLKVTALKDHYLMESQEYEKSEWLGAVIAKWAGVEFAKAAKPKD